MPVQCSPISSIGGSASCYRAKLCLCAVLAVALCLSVRLSVCLSRTLVDCIHRAEDIVKLFVRPCSPVILVFFYPQHRYPIPRGTPSAGVQNTRGGKILRFSTEIAVYLGNGTRYVHDCYETLIGSHRRRIDPCQFR